MSYSKEKKKEYARLWWIKNKEKYLIKNREWKIKNSDKIKQYNEKNKIKRNLQNKQWKLNNPDKVKAQKRKDDKTYYQKTKDKQLPKRREYNKLHYRRNKERIKAYHKEHSQIPEVKARRTELARIWRRNNPRSNGIKDLDLRWAMNRVRLRDNNTCQWLGCGLSHKMGMPIHVHHIFPRSEYPELELIERYMICYCANHHGMFHRYRGDPYSEMISWKEENDQYAMENYH